MGIFRSPRRILMRCFSDNLRSSELISRRILSLPIAANTAPVTQKGELGNTGMKSPMIATVQIAKAKIRHAARFFPLAAESCSRSRSGNSEVGTQHQGSKRGANQPAFSAR